MSHGALVTLEQQVLANFMSIKTKALELDIKMEDPNNKIKFMILIWY